MQRVFLMLAAALSGLTIVVLIVLAVSSQRPGIEALPDNAPVLLDPVEAAADIAEQRAARGSVLAGTLLGQSESPEEFQAVVARQVGIEWTPPDAASDLPETLRRDAEVYDEHADQYEKLARYAEADELRQLAQTARVLARKLATLPSVESEISTAQKPTSEEAVR